MAFLPYVDQSNLRLISEFKNTGVLANTIFILRYNHATQRSLEFVVCLSLVGIYNNGSAY